MISTLTSKCQFDKLGVFFLNHKNSASGTGGVGTVTREMLKDYPGLNYIYSDHSTRETASDTECNVGLSEKEFCNLHGDYTKLYLWPLLHCLKSSLNTSQSSEARMRYLETISKFATSAVRFARRKYPTSPRLYWVNDYVLVGAIKYLRELDPNAVIAFSFRTSFGTATVIPALSKDDVKLMKDNLSLADFITVHRKSDKKNLEILLDNEELNIEVVPMGNSKAYRESLLKSKESLETAARFKQRFPHVRIISSISRFEMSKGIDYELTLLNTLLETYPEIRGRFVFIRYSYVSEQKRKANHYLAYRKHLDNKIRQINSKYGFEGWVPIVSDLDYKLNDREVSGILSISDILIIASYADGFNHLTLEYILSRKGKFARLFVSDIGARDYLLGYDSITHDKERDSVALFGAIGDRRLGSMTRSILLKYSANKLSANKWVSTILKKMVEQMKRYS